MVGQPFDLVKVRMQTGQYSSPITAITDTLKNEGILAFYKGTLAPLIGVGACVSIQFYRFHEAKRLILKRQGDNKKDLSLKEYYLCGFSAGVANTPVTAPVEQIRILLQIQKDNASKLYQGPKDAVSKIYKETGLFKGIFRGTGVTLLRDAQAYGVWFLTYEFLIQNATKLQNIERKDISTVQLLLFGALAGADRFASTF